MDVSESGWLEKGYINMEMIENPVRIWTIGHSTRTSEEFIALLESHEIRVVADVRQFPGSRRHPQFGRQRLSLALEAAGLLYTHLPELGGRRATRPDSPNTAWRNAAFHGYADYMMTESFRLGIERLVGLARQQKTAMMCAEALWWRCHSALIADNLKAHGHKVFHILSADKVQAHPYTSAARIIGGKLSDCEEQDLLSTA